MPSRRHPATIGPSATADSWSPVVLGRRQAGTAGGRPGVRWRIKTAPTLGDSSSLVEGSDMARLLVIEDQKKLLNSLRQGLEEEGYEVVAAATGEQGYYAATTEEFDAVVLDLMLPGRDGL